MLLFLNMVHFYSRLEGPSIAKLNFYFHSILCNGFWMNFKGPYNFMIMALGSCVKWFFTLQRPIFGWIVVKCGSTNMHARTCV